VTVSGTSGERPLVEMRAVRAGYNGTPVLDDIDLTVYEKDFIGLLGPNGGGKTTLLKVLLGLIEPDQGSVRVLGRPPRETRHRVGYVPQSVEFDSRFPVSVWDVALMGRLGARRILHRFLAEDRHIVAESLRNVEMLDLSRRPIGELSGGQRQRVYIARALAAQPALLLLDEPMASVDPQVRTHLYDVLARINEKLAIVMVSHDVSAVSTYVKTIGCLNRRLYYHRERQITPEMLEEAYQCPVDLIAHGVPHRVFLDHSDGD
jgi:zinc transport system ATP-binding protein